MFVSQRTIGDVNAFNNQVHIVAYFESDQARVDALAELRIAGAEAKRREIGSQIDEILRRTPVGPPGTLRI